MKNKKRFSIAKLCLGYSAKKNYLIYLFLILLSVGINSCKKDLLVPNTTKTDLNKDKIKSISYAQFLTSINLNNTGILKTSLSNAVKTDKGALMNNDAASNGFIIDTDSVKKLTLGDTVSYSIGLKPETPHAIQFRNLTIQVLNNKTTAFLTTYVPTQEYVKAYKTNKQTPFKGLIYANKISLADLPQINGLNNSNQGAKGSVMATNTSEILINHNKISLAPGECEIYDVYAVSPRACSTGDMPGSCPWEAAGLTLADVQAINGPGAHLPYYTLERSTVVNCAAPSFPSGGGGEGGGGSTTPNPPGGYDPCNCDTPVPVSVVGGNKGGLKLAVAAPNCCDEGGGGTGGGLPPVIIEDPGSFNQEDPGDYYTLKIIADSIKLANRFECFNNVPDNGSTVYNVKLYTELADKNRPGALLNSSLIPGHTFITMTKTNGAITVSETFGFYPESATKASFQLPVKSMVVDNQDHAYDASLTMTVTANQFTAMMNTAVNKAKNKYDMTEYNCTNFALDVFNQGRSTSLNVPDNIGIITGKNYGKTPTGLYEVVKNMQTNGVNGASVSIGIGLKSTKCN